MKPLIIYHDNCADGMLAAYLFSISGFKDADFRPMQYGDDPPASTQLIPGRIVFVLDFSFSRPVMEQMAEVIEPQNLLVLDHHKTAAEDCRGLPYCIFNMQKCGARLAYEYLQGEGLLTATKRLDTLVAYVEDRDLWKRVLPKSNEVSAAIRSYPFDFASWDWIANIDLKQLMQEGAAIQRYRELLVARHMDHASKITLGDVTGWGVYCSCGDIISEVAGKLAVSEPFGCCWFDVLSDQDIKERVYSLRSEEGGLDVSEIAKAYGGGGHEHAAGFRLPR